MACQIQVFRMHLCKVALVLSTCSRALGAKQAMHAGHAKASVHLSAGAEKGQLFEDPYTTGTLIALGNGYCRVMTPSGPEKDGAWTTYKKCIDLASCKNECHGGCAGIAWTARPADVNYDECYQSDLPRCVVYLGMEPATTYATNMGADQDYTCYRGPGGAATPAIEPEVAPAAPTSGAALGNGYCRVMTPSGPEKDGAWTTYKKCIDLACCRGECHEGCAGIAWTARPADVNYDECYQSGLPRCVVYLGMEPATTYATNMGADQDYTCYQGPGGAAIPTGTALGNGYCRVMTPSGPGKDEGWTTYKKCIDLASCRNECHEGCAGIAWTATPADVNFDECYQSDLPRCVVYLGMVPAKTYETSMGAGQDYTCYRGPGGTAITN